MKRIIFSFVAIMALSLAVGSYEMLSVLPPQASSATPSRGEIAVAKYGCGSCHTIPGIRAANGLVGPSLERIAIRTYIAGVLSNSPDNLERWIRNPPAVDPLTAMPNLHIPDDDIQDLVAYLRTLR